MKQRIKIWKERKRNFEKKASCLVLTGMKASPRIILAGDSGGSQKMTSVMKDSRRHGTTRI